jgi:biotin carboxyl carrier protein
MDLRLLERDRRHHLECTPEGEDLVLRAEGREELRFSVEAHDASTLLLRLPGGLVRARYARRGRELWVQVGTRSVLFHLLDAEEDEELAAAEGSPVIRAPMPGKLLEILVEAGQAVSAGQPVVRVEAMKMEVELPATIDGRVVEIHAAVGDLVSPENPLVTLEGVAGDSRDADEES